MRRELHHCAQTNKMGVFEHAADPMRRADKRATEAAPLTS
jgi:hypothetical protein